MFTFSTILLLISCLFSFTSAVTLPNDSRRELNVVARQVVTSTSSAFGPGASGSPIDDPTDETSVPTACYQTCQITFQASVDDNVFYLCDPANYTSFVDCTNCLVANGFSGTNVTSAQTILDQLSDVCRSSGMTSLTSTGTITATPTTTGPFTDFPSPTAVGVSGAASSLLTSATAGGTTIAASASASATRSATSAPTSSAVPTSAASSAPSASASVAPNNASGARSNAAAWAVLLGVLGVTTLVLG